MGSGASNEKRNNNKTIKQKVINEASPERPNTCGSPRTTEWKWQQFVDGVEWKDLPREVSAELETANSKPPSSKSSINAVIASRMHTFDLNEMVCQTTGSDQKRPIRRVEVEKNVVDPFSAEFSEVPGATMATTIQSNRYTTELYSVISAHNSPVFATCFFPDGDRIVTCAKDGTVKYWEVASSFLRTEFEKVHGSVLSVDASSIAPLIVTGSDNYVVRVYDVDTPSPKASLAGHTHKVYGVKFTRDGRTLLSGSMDATLKVWDVNKMALTRSVKCHDNSIFSMAVSPISPWLAITASDDTTMRAHDLRVGGDTTVTTTFKGHTQTLWGCDIRFDDGQFISCGMDSKVCQWDPRNPSAPIKVISSHRNPVHCVEYLPEGLTFLSSSRDQSFKIHDAVTGETLLSRKAHDGHVYRATYNAVRNLLMTCGADSTVKLWNTKMLF